MTATAAVGRPPRPARAPSGTARAVLTVAAAGAALGACWHGVTLARATARETGAWMVSVPVRATQAMPPEVFDLTTAHGLSPLQPDGARSSLWLESPGTGTALLAGAGRWIPWLALGLCLLIALPALRRAAGGTVFTRSTVRASAAVGAVITLAWGADGLLPAMAARSAIAAEASGLPAAWFGPDVRLAGWPLGYLAASVLLALVVRAGIPAPPEPWNADTVHDRTPLDPIDAG